MTISQSRAAFWYRDFRYYAAARFLSLCAYQMLVVAIAQYVYELTGNPLHLGYIGLSFFFPKIIFTLPAGHVADRFDRRTVILLCRMVQFGGTIILIGLLSSQRPSLAPLYLLLFAIGSANAFEGPSSQSIVPQLVPTEHFGNAVAWNSSLMQIAFIAGPALGGALYAASETALLVLGGVAIIRFVAIGFTVRIRRYPPEPSHGDASWQTVMAGIRYVGNKRLLLGTLSLDLFAVLFGGAVALMPIYANDILRVGPSGLGILRAAPSLGAALMAITLAHLPPLKKAGSTMLSCVAIFGGATIVFGISGNFILSVASLVVLGAADMVSVVIRGVLVQMKTPPAMRGRVSAVNMIFIGASNELGEFESGLTARWFGVVPAVVIGGIGTLLVVAIWAWRFPEIGRCRRLDDREERDYVPS